jgi:hypothetical protein
MIAEMSEICSFEEEKATEATSLHRILPNFIVSICPSRVDIGGQDQGGIDWTTRTARYILDWEQRCGE